MCRRTFKTRPQYPVRLMERPLNKERPSAGSSWLLLAMPVTVLLFWLWIGVESRFWFWFWLEVMLVKSIGWRGRKENYWKDIVIAFITLGSSLVARPQLFHQTHLLLVDMPHWATSTSFCWIAAHIYFVWSPELMRLGLVVTLRRAAQMNSFPDDEQSALESVCGATLWFQNLVKSIVEIATTSGWASRSIAASACGLVIKTAEAHSYQAIADTIFLELLAAEHSDEEPDNGELEGSGDDY
ncbi:hypothetical protein B0H13DRAFT_1910264 [Mycena leptocephala]|nr:hypothetical protein B0H13DRAFT_1910264 [Mycena leptocephala]